MEKKSNKFIWWIVAAVIVLAAAGLTVYALSQRDETTAESETSQQPSTKTTQDTDQEEAATAGTTVTFTDEGFEPDNYTVQKGETVTVENRSSNDHQFSSDDHPAHTDETELNLAVLQSGESATFTPTRVGEWGFHDHLNKQFDGTLTVTE